MQRRSFFTLSALALLASSLPLSAFAIDEAKKEIVIGTTVGDFADMVTDAIKPQLEAKGYKVKLVEFTDYVTPNIAQKPPGTPLLQVLFHPRLPTQISRVPERQDPHRS